MSVTDSTPCVVWSAPVAASLAQALSVLPPPQGRAAAWYGIANAVSGGFVFGTNAAVLVVLPLTTTTLGSSVIGGTVLIDCGALEFPPTTNRWRLGTVTAVGSNVLVNGVELATSARAALPATGEPTPATGATGQLDTDVSIDGTRWLLVNGLPSYHLAALSTIAGLGGLGAMWIETSGGVFTWTSI